MGVYTNVSPESVNTSILKSICPVPVLYGVVSTRHAVNSIPELELMGNSNSNSGIGIGIGIAYFGIGIGIGIAYFGIGIGIEVCYKKLLIHKLTITIYIYCFIYFIELSKEEHLKCMYVICIIVYITE